MTRGQHCGELPPTPGQLRALAEYLRMNSHKLAGERLGMTAHSSRNRVHEAIVRVGEESPGAAAIALGWLTLPDDDDLARAAYVRRSVAQLRRSIDEAEDAIRRLEALQ